MLPDNVKDTRVAQAVEAMPGALLGAQVELGETTLDVAPASIVAVCRRLKEGEQFNRLSAVTCVDWHPIEPRFQLVYHLHSTALNQRLRLRCRVPGDQPEIDSVFAVWKSADWYEREVFDLFGVVFRNHPNLTRILMPDDWQGHPLRKDYPVHGFKYSYPQE